MIGKEWIGEDSERRGRSVIKKWIRNFPGGIKWKYLTFTPADGVQTETQVHSVTAAPTSKVGVDDERKRNV